MAHAIGGSLIALSLLKAVLDRDFAESTWDLVLGLATMGIGIYMLNQ